MTTTDLHDAMVTLAEQAPEPPADLLARVETGHRRRRRKQAATAAFAAVLALAGGAWAVTRPPDERALPTAGFTLPPIPARPPLITETWPGATVSGPLPQTPDGQEPIVVGRADAGHLLVWGRVAKPAAGATTTLWSYAVGENVYREVLTDLPANAETPKIAVAGAALYRIQQDGGIGRITSSPIGGGSMREISTYEGPFVPTGIFADDRNVYWSDLSTRVKEQHIERFTPGLEAFDSLPEFNGLTVDGTVWARNEKGTRFRNLVTGEDRVVVRPAGVGQFDCVAAFCLGRDQTGWFLQRTDGADRTALPYPGVPRLAGATMLVLEGGVLLDPVSGKFGVGARDPQCVRVSLLAGDLLYHWGGGECAGPVETAYIGASD